MAVYAIAIIPLILTLINYMKQDETNTGTVGYADDIGAAGKILALKKWWDKMCELGPKFGYYSEGSKSWLIVKSDQLSIAREIFKDTGINITAEGRRYLGSVIGTNEFISTYIDEKIDETIKEIQTLSEIASYEPQAAYCAFLHGLKHKITFLLRTTPNISSNLKRLDDYIDEIFIPAITGGKRVSELERQLLALPPNPKTPKPQNP